MENIKKVKMNINPYEIEIKENSIKIGCQKYTPTEWINFTDEKISEMDEGALEWWLNNSVEIVSTYYYAFVEKTLQIALMEHEENSASAYYFLITNKSETNKYYCTTDGKLRTYNSTCTWWSSTDIVCQRPNVCHCVNSSSSDHCASACSYK